MKRTSPRPAMKHSVTSSEVQTRAPWSLPEATLAYFPNARFVSSDRDLGAGAAPGIAASRSTACQTWGGITVADPGSGPTGFGHVPVLAQRCFELLTPALTRYYPDGSQAVLLDATIGAGGHAERFLEGLPGLRLIGLDRDPTALDVARSRLVRFADRLTLVHTRYDCLGAALAESGYAAVGSVDGILFDLGVSSMQLDRAERGFAYATDAPLDMRMDPTTPLTAADIVNTYDEAALADILRRYGEERFARRIAAGIVRRRAKPRSPRPPNWLPCCTRRFQLRPGVSAGIQPSEHSRRCASRSTMSWNRCARPFLPRWMPSLSVGASRCWPTSR